MRGSDAVVAPAPTAVPTAAVGAGAHADVVFEGLTTQFRRASAGASRSADTAPPQYQPCDAAARR
jgi:hypothetical protein